jgi:hypothetical protein
MLPQNAAAREAMQEGGVIGEVHRDAIADMIVRKRNGSGLSTSFRLLIFPLMVTTELAYWPEGHFREVRGYRRRRPDRQSPIEKLVQW